ncbi:hypothetical protein JCGZ_12572 [Jatropha curcas]|uniref:RRM domain-containing protein n=2 Tax=Jatropha curcas TaxID=180498 RepID=A0A067K791_JATCU|nr:hypothetical protein JCGZ_12572 [Jatropha curcas]
MLRRYFGKYGQVKEVLIVLDKITGISRGFGFVTFEDPSAADKALQHRDHFIRGKKVDVKPAIPKRRSKQEQDNDEDSNSTEFRTKKIFVGGLPPNITKEELKNFFDSFGTITDAVVIHNKLTGKPRGFGFISFDSEETVDIILQERYRQFNGYVVEVKKAKSTDMMGKNDNYINNMGFYGSYPSYYPYYWDTYNALPYFYPGGSTPFAGWVFPQNYLEGGDNTSAPSNQVQSLISAGCWQF